MSDLSDKPIAFGAAATKRIVAAVKRIEGSLYPDVQPIRPNIATWSGVVDAIVTSAISPCNGLTYGTGMAQIYIDDGNGNAIVDIAYPGDDVNGNSVTVLNWLTNSNTIAVNTHIIIAPRDGYWRLITGDC